MSETTSTRGNVRIYAAGGCGVNIGYLLEDHRKTESVAAATISTAYIDTSRSNMREDIDASHVYLMDSLDGSGKIRKENYQEIASRTKDILQKFAPLDLNIVISSAAGGSGSVIAPSLVSELLAKNAPTIVMLVGSADTRLDADNTLKTLKSYEAISKLREAPVVIVYQQNSKTNPRKQVDETLKGTIVSLAVLWSGHNRELDSKDLFNFLNFHIPTSFKPQLAYLSLVGPGDHLEEGGEVISVATLALEGQETALDTPPEVQFVGFVASDAPQGVKDNIPLHFFTTNGVFESVAKILTKTLKDSEAHQQARIDKGGLLSDADQPTSTGLVF